MPAPYPTIRERTPGEQLANHMRALRSRLDWLVDAEEREGDAQPGVHYKRAERNALIYALGQFADLAKGSAGPKPPPERKHAPEYVRGLQEQCDALAADGFTRPDRKPGVLIHAREESAAPVEVPLAVWFYMRGRADAP